jgi:S-DNA-T family DNA segregation ATPase FtsK/SpoIIIE
MLGLIVLVAAGLLLLALVSYTPSDPSFNTVGGLAGPHPARNWTGVAGAYLSDLLLQAFGVAVLFLPIILGRIGVSWMRSRAVGSTATKCIGISLWLIFAPAAIALLPGATLWRKAIPISGIEGRILADALVRVANLPGAALISGLMVALSLYLSTTFLLTNAGPWFTEHLSFVRAISNRYQAFKHRKDAPAADAFASRRQQTAAALHKQADAAAAEDPDADHKRRNSLLAGLLGFFGRRKAAAQEADSHSTLGLGDDSADTESPSVWKSMPRTLVQDVPITALHAATAAAAPFAAQLAAAAAPIRSASDTGTAEDDNWLDSPERNAPPPLLPRSQRDSFDLPEPPPARLPQDLSSRPDAHSTNISSRPERSAVERPAAPPVAPFPSPTANIRDQNIAFGNRADANQLAATMLPKSIRGYKLPPTSLLYRNTDHVQVREDLLREEARILVEKCAEFGVDGTVEQINPGPVVTTFEFRPDAGVKVARIVGLADDLCLAMAAESILIERMPGKSTVGIQVPNRDRETIWLRDVVESESFANSKSRLAIALGKDISGRIVTHDLASMPHVLIAGSTGSGKSVAINAMIMSVLFKSTPEQVRMILVDPKRVELGMYEGIPHLFTPIITEAKLAANALRNAVREMERRLKLLAANHVRNIDQFNKLFDHGSEYLFEDVNQEPLPYIMIIIDELADLMMLDRANVEEAITRLAQMARAVGIHLVLATQRPSVDVITGLIKANVPTRMSFRLATKVDSRTIIDSNGAESLLGRGDMLFLPPGTSRLQRVHAPFVTEKETAAVVDFWKAQGTAEYAEGFLEGPKDEKLGDGISEGESSEDDALFDDAVRLVFEFGKASTSLLQRRLRIGYGRAAHLIDMMERDGLVGPAEGSKPREILKPANYFAEADAAMR